MTDGAKGVQNHITSPLGDFERSILEHIPPGGNWKNIPLEIKDKRVDSIRATGGRTTYYGRLHPYRPAYTISTFFSRTGNGCFIHPHQDRLISQREAARLQSFPDDFVFEGPKTSIYKQIGNAVPPLLGRAFGELLQPTDFIDLFAGAGGLSLGLEMTGAKCKLAVEFQKHMCTTFRANHDVGGHDVLCLDLNTADLEAVFSPYKGIDLVCGGPPCQGFSLAGKCLDDDPRNHLVRQFIKVIEIVRPKYLLMENVKGLLWFSKGQVLAEIKEALSKLGYNVEHQVMKAVEFGVPQKRERVFVLGTLESKPIEFPKPIFSDSDPGLPQPITVDEALSDLPALEIGGGTYESTPYNSNQPSAYQKFMRGMINFDEFLEERNNTPWYLDSIQHRA